MRGGNRPVVVKLGGSFAFSVHLRDWIEALAACAGQVVIVPGGGPFADAVRTAQPRMGFDEAAAHDMAVLAMEQFGRALVSLNDALSPADSADAIDRVLAAERVPVWMPARMVSAAWDVAPSWDTTSDSLAAWLAGRIGARRLILVKHGDIPRGPANWETWVANGLVDKTFAQYVNASGSAVLIFGPADQAAAIAALHEGAAGGVAAA